MGIPKWFEYIQVRERRLLGTKVPPDFLIAFGPTNIIKPHATAEKAERQVESIRNWLSIHMQHESADHIEKVRVLREALQARAVGELLADGDIKPTSPEFDVQAEQLVDFWIQEARAALRSGETK